MTGDGVKRAKGNFAFVPVPGHFALRSQERPTCSVESVESAAHDKPEPSGRWPPLTRGPRGCRFDETCASAGVLSFTAADFSIFSKYMQLKHLY